MQKSLSPSNYDRHRSAVYSLLAQFATSSLILAPPFVYMVVTINQVDFGQFLVEIILAVFASRSVVNAVVLITTTPPYRKFVVRSIFRKKMEPRKESILVSMVHRSVKVG